MTKLKSNLTCREQGSALLVALLASSLLAALGLALASLTVVETTISSNHRAGSQAFYAADAVAEAILADLLTTPNWTDILTGAVSSRLNGHAVPPAGPGAIPRTLAQLTADVQAESDAAGVWGPNTPRWRLFAYGWLTELAPIAAGNSDEYLTAWAADDIDEADGDPLADTNGRLQFVARASSARGMQRRIALTVAQTPDLTMAGSPAIRILAWREIR
jgi:hypothetical protein